jgi:glycosyltransferase involved in cell wall biosynthesis
MSRVLKQFDPLSTKNLFVLTHWSFNDPLIQTYTLPYVKLIRNNLHFSQKIYLITYEAISKDRSLDNLAQINSVLHSYGIHLIQMTYYKFGLRKLFSSLFQFIYLLFFIFRNRIDVIHCFCTPAGGIGYILSLLSRKTLVIDSYEPHSESMLENGTWKKSSLSYRILSLLETLQSRRASCLIATTYSMKDYALNRYFVETNRFYVKPACVDLDKFNYTDKCLPLRRTLELENKFICVYAGKLGGIYLDDEIADFVSSSYEILGDKFKFLFLTSSNTDDFFARIQYLKVPMSTIILKHVPHIEMPVWLSLADFAINPVKPVASKRYCTSIKDGEYWACGLPVVIPTNISDDSSIIHEHDIGYVLKSLSHTEYSNAIIKILDLHNNYGKDFLRSKIRNIASHYRGFDIAESIYQEIYG